MFYSRAFFDLQLTFAQALAVKFNLSLSDALYTYTTLPNTLAVEDDWIGYVTGLAQTTNLAEWTYQFYLVRRGHMSPPMPADQSYYGYPLFGCFYFIVRDTSIIRPHFIKNDVPGISPLSYTRAGLRRDELRRMFAYIKQYVPEATTVLGNSWMYNLHAYRRLYPPAYTAAMEVSEEDEFQYLVRWGQFYDAAWNVKDQMARELFRRLETLTDLAHLRFCFPYQILRPQVGIDQFYTFYGIE